MHMDRNLTILLAEDNEDDAIFLERVFRKLGPSEPVRIVRDGAEAIDYLKGEGNYADRREFPFPNLLFTDLKMPRVSGFQVLEWLRNHSECRTMPVIVFSSSADPDDVARAYQLGANAYFVKPGQLGEMEELLKSAYEFWARCERPPVAEMRC